ncbi:MAG: 4Fe-4S binding protein [Phycisphaerae bacterium]
MIVQVVRRMVQGTVLLLVAGIALLSLYAHYRAAGAIDDPQLMAGLRGEAVTRFIHPTIERLDDPEAFLDGNKGTVWSMRLFGVGLTDPLAAVEAVAASRHVHWPLLIETLLPIILTFVFGKVFCSWICPGYLLFEITGKLRRLLRLVEIQPGEVRFAHANKYVFLLVGVVLAAVFSAPIFALIYPPAVISRLVHAWIFGTELVGMLVLLGLIIAFELFVSPRWWCRAMCPGGALYGLLGVRRIVRVKLQAGACTGCQACLPVCEAGINPITESESIECDNCGVCIRHCGDGALHFALGMPTRACPAVEQEPVRGSAINGDPLADPPSRGLQPARPHRALSGRRRRAAGASSRAKTAARLIALLVPLVLVRPASGHHILGLPHYSYKENYPQRPTLEYPATTGPYDVVLTSYPGIPVPGVPANLAFYIKNRETKQVYASPVTVRILRTSTFGDNTLVMPPTERPPFDNEHKFQFAFPSDGEYVVELSLMVEGRKEIIPFLMVAGEPGSAASFAVGGSVLLVLAFILLRAVHKKRERRRKAGSLSVIAASGGA